MEPVGSRGQASVARLIHGAKARWITELSTGATGYGQRLACFFLFRHLRFLNIH